MTYLKKLFDKTVLDENGKFATIQDYFSQLQTSLNEKDKVIKSLQDSINKIDKKDVTISAFLQMKILRDAGVLDHLLTLDFKPAKSNRISEMKFHLLAKILNTKASTIERYWKEVNKDVKGVEEIEDFYYEIGFSPKKRTSKKKSG